MEEDRDSRKGGKLVRVALLRNRLWGEIHRYPRFNIPLNLCQTFAPHSTGLYNTYGGHWHMGHLRPWGFHIEQPCRKRAMHVANLATHLLAARWNIFSRPKHKWMHTLSGSNLLQIGSKRGLSLFIQELLAIRFQFPLQIILPSPMWKLLEDLLMESSSFFDGGLARTAVAVKTGKTN